MSMNDQLPPQQPPPQPLTGSPQKEFEPGALSYQEVPGIVEVGHETPIEMPTEVQAAGVTVHPTTVTIPPNVAKMGVTVVGTNTQQANQPAIVLPLSDDKITQGLNQSVTSSWRWLAEWCKRRLKVFFAQERKDYA